MAKASKNYRTIENSERAVVPGATNIGPADPKEKISISIRVRRQGGPAIADINAPTAMPYNRKHLSCEEYAANYGADQVDLDKVADFAKANGLTVVESSIPRRTLVLSGAIAQINSAFAVDLQQFHAGAEIYRSYKGKVAAPSDIVDIVESVHGFDNRQMARPIFRAAIGTSITTALRRETSLPALPPWRRIAMGGWKCSHAEPTTRYGRFGKQRRTLVRRRGLRSNGAIIAEMAVYA